MLVSWCGGQSRVDAFVMVVVLGISVGSVDVALCRGAASMHLARVQRLPAIT